MLNTTAIGNLGKDAEVRDVNGKKVIQFSIAHTETYKDAQGIKTQRTTWVNCSYWTDRTAVAQYLKSGGKVAVIGTPTVAAYLSKKDNKPAASLELRVNSIELLDRKPDAIGHSGPANGATSSQPATTTGDVEDDLPF